LYYSPCHNVGSGLIPWNLWKKFGTLNFRQQSVLASAAVRSLCLMSDAYMMYITEEGILESVSISV